MSLNTQSRKLVYQWIKGALGSSFQKNLTSLTHRQFMSEQENRQAQQIALLQILEKAGETIPYYRQLFERTGFNPKGRFLDLEAFQHLPTLNRYIIQTEGEEHFHQQPDQGEKIRRLTTSGTTGTTIHAYLDAKAWDWYSAQIWFFWGWMGLSMGMPYFYFWGAPRDFSYSKFDLLSYFWMEVIQNRHVINCAALSEETMYQSILAMNKQQEKKHIVAYTNELYDLACFSKDNKLPITRTFEGISVTTARLTEQMRSTLQEVFHCPVFSRYGCREIGDIACECHFKRGFHVNPHYSYVEVVDENNQPVPPGIEGRILVTSLHNTYMPLIRYDTGDLGIMAEPGPCLCGRNWLTIERITGRVYERLTLPDGSTVGNVFLNYAMEGLNDIRHYQFHHLTPHELEVQFIAAEPDFLERHADRLKKARLRLEVITNRQVDIRFRQVDALIKAPSGKHLMFISHLKKNQAEPDDPMAMTCRNLSRTPGSDD